jgi:hypothetical protein
LIKICHSNGKIRLFAGFYHLERPMKVLLVTDFISIEALFTHYIHFFQVCGKRAARVAHTNWFGGKGIG